MPVSGIGLACCGGVMKRCNFGGCGGRCPDPTCWLRRPHDCKCKPGVCLGGDGRTFKVKCVEVIEKNPKEKQ